MNLSSGMFRDALSEQLITLRESKALTRRAMAKKISYSYAVLTAKETGKSPVNSDDLAAYARFFGIFPSDILSLAEQSLVKRN